MPGLWRCCLHGSTSILDGGLSKGLSLSVGMKVDGVTEWRASVWRNPVDYYNLFWSFGHLFLRNLLDRHYRSQPEDFFQRDWKRPLRSWLFLFFLSSFLLLLPVSDMISRWRWVHTLVSLRTCICTFDGKINYRSRTVGFPFSCGIGMVWYNIPTPKEMKTR